MEKQRLEEEDKIRLQEESHESAGPSYLENFRCKEIRPYLKEEKNVKSHKMTMSLSLFSFPIVHNTFMANPCSFYCDNDACLEKNPIIAYDFCLSFLLSSVIIAVHNYTRTPRPQAHNK